MAYEHQVGNLGGHDRMDLYLEYFLHPDAGSYDVGPKWEYPLAVFHRMVRDAVGPLD